MYNIGRGYASNIHEGGHKYGEQDQCEASFGASCIYHLKKERGIQVSLFIV